MTYLFFPDHVAAWESVLCIAHVEHVRYIVWILFRLVLCHPRCIIESDPDRVPSKLERVGDIEQVPAELVLCLSDLDVVDKDRGEGVQPFTVKDSEMEVLALDLKLSLQCPCVVNNSPS